MVFDAEGERAVNDLLEQAHTLQGLLASRATGGDESDSEYRQLRGVFMSDPRLGDQLPDVVRTCHSLDQFWQFIKAKFSTYAERRSYLWAAFGPFLQLLEHDGAPSDKSVSATLEEFDAAHVRAVWSKAMNRRQNDPEGAITAARTLLESVCKHILDDLDIAYDDGADLPGLYKATAKALCLAPSQHTEQVFKQILGGCTSVVVGLGSLRNKLSDAHGKGRARVKPSARHAELAVSLSGAMASFLIATWEARRDIKA